MILGDFNVHDLSWFSAHAVGTLGALLCAEREDMLVLDNPDTPSRLPFTTGTHATSPDVSFASPTFPLKLAGG